MSSERSVSRPESSPIKSAACYMWDDFKSYLNEYGIYVLNDQIDAKKSFISEMVNNNDVVVFAKEGKDTCCKRASKHPHSAQLSAAIGLSCISLYLPPLSL